MLKKEEVTGKLMKNERKKHTPSAQTTRTWGSRRYVFVLLYAYVAVSIEEH